MANLVQPTTFNAHAHPPGSYFTRHWRGQLSLGVSCWINGFLLGGVLPGVLIGYATTRPASEFAEGGLRLAACVWLGILLFCVAITVWGYVGIWRSANRHKSRGGRGFWARSAQVVIVLAIMFTATNVAQDHLGRQLWELARIAVGDDPMEAIDADLASDGKSFQLKGTLGSGSAERVLQLFATSPDVKLVSLDSRGGRVFEAESIATEIRRRRMDTYVESKCASACTMIFLAGQERGATPNAQIGFHRGAVAGVEVHDSDSQDRMLTAYRDAGLSATFIDRIKATPSSSMWYPTYQELLSARVVNRVSLGGETVGRGDAAGFTSEEAVRAGLFKAALFQTIERRYPGTIARAAAVAWKTKQSGATDDQMMSAARVVIANLMPDALATAPDDVLEQFADLLRAEMAAALHVGPEACGKFLKSQLDIGATMPPELVKRDSEFTQVLFSAPQRSDAPLNKNQTRMAMTPVLKSLTPMQVEVVSSPGDFDEQPKVKCDALLAYFTAVAQLPVDQRRLALRAMYQGAMAAGRR